MEGNTVLTPGTNIEAVSAPDQVRLIMERFAARRAAEFTYTARSPGRNKVIEVALIPDFLFRDADISSGLLIVAVGGGSYRWNGVGVLSPFTLISAGFRPLEMAKELAQLLNALASGMVAARQRKEQEEKEDIDGHA